MSDPETLKVYAAQAQTYADLTDGAVASDPMLTAFIASLPARAHVLDIGCGPGTSARVIAAAEHTVTALDPVPEMVALSGQHPGVTARIGGFEDITESRKYNAIWANFSLLHAPRSDMPRTLAAFHRALIAPGILHIALKLGTGEKRDAIGRLYTYYTEAELRGLLTQQGFSVTDHATGRDKGLDGTYADWIALRADG